MKAVLKLELIADNLYQFQYLRRQGKVSRDASWHQEINLIRFGNKKLKPWVARVNAGPNGQMEREFQRPQLKDYSQANSSGSRGIFAYYTLSDGMYEVNERTSWSKARRYFIRVVEDTITEIPKEEVLACLSESASV